MTWRHFRKRASPPGKQANVSENVAADILGHEKPRVTYGRAGKGGYSGGASLAQKREAIKELKYPEIGEAK